MIKIIVIAAQDANRVIGIKNKLPWHLPNEMTHFKEETKNSAVIMGWPTYESFDAKFRPLPGRDNIIIARHSSYQPSQTNNRTFVRNSLLGAARLASDRGFKIAHIIGGGQIYQEALSQDIADEILLSVIDGAFEGDTYFPVLPVDRWKPTFIKSVPIDAKNPYGFNVIKYTRKSCI